VLSSADGLTSRRQLLAGPTGSDAGLAALSQVDGEAKPKKKSRKKGKGKAKGSGKGQGSGNEDRHGGGGGGNRPAQYDGPVFTVSGRSILDTDGEPVALRGVNKMPVFDDEDPRGNAYFVEIAQAKSNTARIVWAPEVDNGPTTVNDLTALIANCQANKMLPMIELHDATGDLSKLPKLGNYWTRNGVLQVIFNVGGNLLINIGNEVGDDRVTANQWVAAYTPVIRQMRTAGIRTPLVIDAPDFGKKLEVVVAGAKRLLAVDPT
jgi:mannan endo-1,4-beta-mannosidase